MVYKLVVIGLQVRDDNTSYETATNYDAYV